MWQVICIIIAVLMGLVGLAVTGVVWLLSSYKKALQKSRDSLLMRLLGRRGFMKVLARLYARSTSSSAKEGQSSTYDRMMHRDAREKIAALANDPVALAGDGICMIGSSTFTYWRFLQRDMAPLPVFNAAFGGSCTYHLMDDIEPLCTRYRPKLIVYFCGTNDLSRGRSSASVLEGTLAFLDAVRQELPDVPFVYLAATITPFHQYTGAQDKVGATNQLLADALSQRPYSWFVDPNEQAFVRDERYFLGDNHHLNDEGHVLLGELLRPVIEEALHTQEPQG